jgi:uncharacterized protein (TIGR00369 family)
VVVGQARHISSCVTDDALPLKGSLIQHVGLHIEPHHLNTSGVVLGGALFSLANTAMDIAVHTALAPNERCATVDARIGYWLPAQKGELPCVARLPHRKGQVTHMKAREVARATGVFAVFKVANSNL